MLVWTGPLRRWPRERAACAPTHRTQHLVVEIHDCAVADLFLHGTLYHAPRVHPVYSQIKTVWDPGSSPPHLIYVRASLSLPLGGISGCVVNGVQPECAGFTKSQRWAAVPWASQPLTSLIDTLRTPPRPASCGRGPCEVSPARPLCRLHLVQPRSSGPCHLRCPRKDNTA